MATVTPNFNWPVPTSTDLVKDGATAIEALGDSIDASLVDLKGGTTGQVLSKTSNTDMDFTWVAADDTNAIQNTIVDAKGDLIAASAADTPARLAVGNNGETLVADSSTSTGLRYQGNYAAGKNAMLNSDFSVWQRGTSINLTNGLTVFTADRWQCVVNFTAGTASVSRQAFTPGGAPVAGYEGQYFFRLNTGTTATTIILNTKLENVQTYAGQTVTFSFWGRSSSNVSLVDTFRQNFGSGGSTSVDSTSTSYNLTTSWQRFTRTLTLASIAGKTIGAGSNLQIYLEQGSGALGGLNIDLWGMQLESGSVATAFQTATGNPALELAACQRYLYRFGNNVANEMVGTGGVIDPNTCFVIVAFPIELRATPTFSLSTASDFNIQDGTVSGTASTISANILGTKTASFSAVLVGLTIGRAARVFRNGSASGAFIQFSAEL
jgi:hypothetical protein